MKNFTFKIEEGSKKFFFPHCLIKSKVQIIEILMLSCRHILINEPVEETTPSSDQLILVIDKMSRLFFLDKNKYYSINFPFTFFSTGQTRTITYDGMLDIDSKLISDILSIIKDSRFNSENFFDFADTFAHLDDYYLGRIWALIKELLIYEDGYLRIDYDKEQYLVAKNNGREHTHPENHIDIFYTGSNTFKLGLLKNVDNDFFVNLLNLKTDCFYLKH